MKSPSENVLLLPELQKLQNFQDYARKNFI